MLKSNWPQFRYLDVTEISWITLKNRKNLTYEKLIWSTYGYGSIPIHTIFRGMNIHLPAILMFTRGTRFWHTAIWETYLINIFLATFPQESTVNSHRSRPPLRLLCAALGAVQLGTTWWRWNGGGTWLKRWFRHVIWCKIIKNGDFMAVNGDFMEFNGYFMEFNGDFMEFNGIQWGFL